MKIERILSVLRKPMEQNHPRDTLDIFKNNFLNNSFVLAVLGLLCCMGFFLQLWRVGSTLCCSARVSHCSGFSCCGAWGLKHMGSASCGSWALPQAQQLWLKGLVALQPVRSSWTRDGNCVSCLGRQILYHRATREALDIFFFFNS